MKKLKAAGVTWAPWFVVTWVIVAISLLTSLFLLPFRTWSVLAAVGFGTFEAIGLLREDAYPPLTQVIHRYVPRWAAFLLIYGLVGAAGAYWFKVSQPWRMAAFLGLLGWLSDHFTETYAHE